MSFPFLSFLLKLHRPKNFGMGPVGLIFTQHDLQPEAHFRLRNPDNPIDRAVADSRRNLESKLLEDGMDGINNSNSLLGQSNDSMVKKS